MTEPSCAESNYQFSATLVPRTDLSPRERRGTFTSHSPLAILSSVDGAVRSGAERCGASPFAGLGAAVVNK